jgi:hypothetical protein
MSTTTTQDFEKMMNEKIDQFVSEMFHSRAAQVWARLLLREAVRADILDRVNDFVVYTLDTETFAGERGFRFSGEEVECGLARRGIPHAPHRVDTYSTVRWGAMDYYCLGKEGSITLWGKTITITMLKLERYRGGAVGRVRVDVRLEVKE